MDGALNEFVPNFGKRNGLLVRLTIFYGKSTKLVQLSEKSAVDAHGLFERNGISRVQMTSYAVKRTILVPAKVLTKSRKLPAYRVHFTIVYRALS